MSPLGNRVLEVMATTGRDMTAQEVADILGVSARSVTNALCWLRGEGKVDDGKPFRFVQDGKIIKEDSGWLSSPLKWRLGSERFNA